MSSEIIQSVASDNYDNFQHVNYFHFQALTISFPFLIIISIL
jgi:hypothetical protein